MQKQIEKIVKKRITLGARSQSTDTYSHRFVFSSNNPTAKLESRIHKKWASFKNTSPDMTYAQAVLKNKANNCHIARDQKVLLASALSNHNNAWFHSKHPVHVNMASDKLVYPARKTKALHKQRNVAVPLSNRFTVLASTSDDNTACSDQSIDPHSSVQNIDLNDGDAGKRSFQSEHPSSLGIPQPGLAVQANSLSYGNKNKTGFSLGISHMV